MLVGGILLFAAASLACAVAPGLGFLLAARVVQGIGAAMLMPNSLSILSHAFSGEEKRGADADDATADDDDARSRRHRGIALNAVDR